MKAEDRPVAWEDAKDSCMAPSATWNGAETCELLGVTGMMGETTLGRLLEELSSRLEAARPSALGSIDNSGSDVSVVLAGRWELG